MNGPNRYGIDPLPKKPPESAEHISVDEVGSEVKTTPAFHHEPSETSKSSVTLLGEGYQVPSIHLRAGQEVTIGRSSQADIIIRNRYISKKHLSLSLDDHGSVIARDLNSTNGTYLGGKKLEPGIPHELGTGEQLILGSEDVMYRF